MSFPEAFVIEGSSPKIFKSSSSSSATTGGCSPEEFATGCDVDDAADAGGGAGGAGFP